MKIILNFSDLILNSLNSPSRLTQRPLTQMIVNVNRSEIPQWNLHRKISRKVESDYIRNEIAWEDGHLDVVNNTILFRWSINKQWLTTDEESLQIPIEC